MKKEDLQALTKEELVGLVLTLATRVEELEHHLRAHENPHTPSSQRRKANTERDPSRPRFPGKPRGSPGGGIDLPAPDTVEEHTLQSCPHDCTPLGTPVGVSERHVIDLHEKPIAVVLHKVYRYQCPACGATVSAPHALTGETYGPRLQGLVVLLKHAHLSHQNIARLLRALGAPSFSVAESLAITGKCAALLEDERARIREALRGETHVHYDETGMRQDGKNGWVWCASAQNATLFEAAPTRSGEQAESLLPGFAGVGVTDGYAGYRFLKHRQRCWAHLLRDAKEYAQDDQVIGAQYDRLKALYARIKDSNKEAPAPPVVIAQATRELNDIITCLTWHRPARKLCTLLRNGGDDWLTALHHTGIPLTNNHAERELRPIVLLRKNAGCYRNHKGKAWIDTALSVLHTWALQAKNLFTELQRIMSQPRPRPT